MKRYNDTRRISIASIQSRPPLLFSIVLCLALDRLSVGPWIWLVGFLVIAALWIGWVFDKIVEDAVDIVDDDHREQMLQQMKRAADDFADRSSQTTP